MFKNSVCALQKTQCCHDSGQPVNAVYGCLLSESPRTLKYTVWVNAEFTNVKSGGMYINRVLCKVKYPMETPCHADRYIYMKMLENITNTVYVSCV